MEASQKQIFFASIITIFLILFLLHLHFGNWYETLIIILSLFFALTGGIWLMYFLNYNRSVATDVGFIALAGLAAETAIVMIVYLKESLKNKFLKNQLSFKDIRESVIEGSLLRLRPKLMTVTTTILGLIPIFWSQEDGATVMKRLVIPMIGSLITSTILTLVLIPVIYEFLSLRFPHFLRNVFENSKE